MGACKHWFSTTNRCHNIDLASGSAGTATIHMWRPLGEWHHKRRCRSIVIQSNADDDQESRSVGISAPLLPKLGKYDVRVAPVCICIRQVDLRLTLSTYWLAQNAPVCICICIPYASVLAVRHSEQYLGWLQLDPVTYPVCICILLCVLNCMHLHTPTIVVYFSTILFRVFWKWNCSASAKHTNICWDLTTIA